MNRHDEAHDEWLVDGADDPDQTERELIDAFSPARWREDADSLLQAIESLQRKPLPNVRPSRGPARRVLPMAGSLAAAAIGLAVVAWVIMSPGSAPTTWSTASGDVIRRGEWIATDAGEEARISSSIGRVTVGPGSRVRVVRADEDEHRLHLAHGSIEALIFAPPRIFFVDMPSVTAVDMGCAYRLDVDAAGEGTLQVTGGWVELEAEPVAARVPAGASCRIGAGGALGIPRFDDAPGPFVAALDRFDAGVGDSLDELLQAARPRDSLSLWHVLGRVEAADRSRVAGRLASLVPTRDASIVDRAAALDAGALDAWWSELRAAW
jgi:hypothetical protein